MQIQSTGTFTGALPVTFTIADGTTQTAKVSAGALAPITRVDARWSADNLAKPDLGFTSMFKPDGCSGATPSPDSCELLHRFYSLIDRHENFYQTYSAVDSTSPVIASQPSPLVACSITLAASHQWDTAGTPVGGTAGFIFLMRIPYAQILVGYTRSIDTLGRLNAQDPLHSGPKVLALQDIYAGTAQLDMSKVWFDIATLSHNQFSTEHDVGFGKAGQEGGICRFFDHGHQFFVGKLPFVIPLYIAAILTGVIADVIQVHGLSPSPLCLRLLVGLIDQGAQDCNGKVQNQAECNVDRIHCICTSHTPQSKERAPVQNHPI